MNPHPDDSHPPTPRSGGSRPPLRGLSMAPAAGEGVIDPVCGMTVNPATAPASAEYQGKTYYFCNPTCARRFRDDPEHYLLSSLSVVGNSLRLRRAPL